MNEVDIEKLAMRCEELPKSAAFPDAMLYWSLRYLYCAYRAGNVTRPDAKHEKTRILEQYRNQKQMQLVYEQHMEIRKKLSYISQEIVKSGCEQCRYVLDALSGIFKEVKK